MKKHTTLFLAALAGLALALPLSACQNWDPTANARGMASMANIDSPFSGMLSRHDYPTPVEQMSYAPNDPAYVGYVNEFKGTDTHTFKTGDRSFVMRGTPPLQGVIDPWYDWNDMSIVHSKAVSFDDCGKCALAMGAETVIKTRNLKGHSVGLEICYYQAKDDAKPQCFKGDTLPLSEDVKDWKKLSVTVPFEAFRKLSYKIARLRLSVDGGQDPYHGDRIGRGGFEGVLWADDFHFTLAESDGAGSYKTRLSGALWPDDYSGWDTGWGRKAEPLQSSER